MSVFYTAYCKLDKDTGPCREDLKVMWYFDTDANSCRQFWYGCQGNNNRFKSEKECLTTCQKIVTKGTHYCVCLCMLLFSVLLLSCICCKHLLYCYPADFNCLLTRHFFFLWLHQILPPWRDVHSITVIPLAVVTISVLYFSVRLCVCVCALF